jgi:hypothetical protein
MALGMVFLAPWTASGQPGNKLPGKPPKVGGLAPVPNRNQNQNPPANVVPNNNNPNMNNGGPGFNFPGNNAGVFNPITGGNGGPAFAGSQLNQLYNAASPFNNPFSNPFSTPFNNPFPIVNNPYTYGNLRNGFSPYGYNPFYYPMNNVYSVNPFGGLPAYNSMAYANPYMNTYANPFMNPYGNPYMNPYLGSMADNPLANPFLPSLFYQNLLQNPNPFAVQNPNALNH